MHENNWKCRWRGAWLRVQCRGRQSTAVANNWSLHHECYWEALLILSSSFWESCKGMETATTSNPARLLCMTRTYPLQMYKNVGFKLGKIAVLFKSWKVGASRKYIQKFGYRTEKIAVLLKPWRRHDSRTSAAFSVTSVTVELSCCVEREGFEHPRYVTERSLLVSALCTWSAEVVLPSRKNILVNEWYPDCLPIEPRESSLFRYRIYCDSYILN